LAFNEQLATGHNREHKLQPENAQEKPLAPRVMCGKTLRRQDHYRTNVLTCREKLGSVDLSQECTNTLKTLGRQDQYHANNVQKNVENGRLKIDECTYVLRNVVKTRLISYE